MLEFAKSSGLSPAVASPKRYLWTDAFAVCNFLGLYQKTRDERFKRLALLLVEQVHFILGRWRADDSRSGWISGLDEQEGAQHPTVGGLRIGKDMNERMPGDPYDPGLEWDRDGQYYHYLTQWMHALACVSRATGDPVFNQWAIELAKTAHAKFTYAGPHGEKRMYWKMSVDLSYPLVSSMGHHDPLEGLITYSELRATAEKFVNKRPSLDLGDEIADMLGICEEKSWTTDDPLGIGGLLSGAYRMAQLIAAGRFLQPGLLGPVLDDSVSGLNYFVANSSLNLPARARLAFRELGLSIGLQAIGRLQALFEQKPDVFTDKARVQSLIRRLSQHAGMSDIINTFWFDKKNRSSGAWTDHLNINMVTLATSLFPDGYLYKTFD
jgi:hypothetical protein